MYEFIDAEYATGETAPAITSMCEWLHVSKSGFYEWRNRPQSAAARRREDLAALIRHVFEDSDGTYGYRRIAAQLARSGIAAGPESARNRRPAGFCRWPTSSEHMPILVKIVFGAAMGAKRHRVEDGGP